MKRETTSNQRSAVEREAAGPRAQAQGLSERAAIALSLIITAATAGLVALVIDLVIRAMG